MAAPIEKSEKERKKMSKKLFKLRESLCTKDNIEFIDKVTNIMCVCNGGLDNNVSLEELTALFGQFGGKFEIMMIPQKSYCYVSFEDKTHSQAACDVLNGYRMKPTDHRKTEVVLYTLFVKNVPDNICPSSAKPPGLILLEGYINEEYASDILKSIRWEQQLEIGQLKELKHRRVKHYGYEFKYSINNVDPDDPLQEGIPDVYQPLLEKLRSSGVIGHMPDQLTINQYQPGQGIPPHIDTPSAFEDGLVSLSVGSQVLMEFRHPDGRHLSVLLPHRSVLVMTGESRYMWSHGITPRKSDIVPMPSGGLTLSSRGVRTSFTFRKITGVKPPIQDSEKPSVPSDDSTAAELEKLHVYQVYEEIAEHFSGTRHTPWPHIAEFLKQQAPGSLLVDIGCGNGKYFGINKNLYELGSDRSFNLAKICHERNYQIYVGDVLAIPLRAGMFDVCLCIAVIHHLSTQERRQQAMSELLKVLRPGGKALIYVWAMEQQLNKVKSKYLKKVSENDPQPAHTGDTPDGNMLCGSIIDESKSVDSESTPGASGDSYRSCESCLATVEKCENDSSLAEDLAVKCTSQPKQLEVHVNRTEFKQQDVLVPWQLRNKSKGEGHCEKSSNTFHRFYHVFQKGELEDLCESLGICKVIKSYYDQGNWAVILEKT